MSNSEFKEIPISKNEDFSWVFLVDWILLVILALAVVFYFGRALAHLVTMALEWLLWKRFNIKINIQSLKISFLGGRVFFKNLTIISENQTISFLHGSFTWRYWLMKSRKTQLEIHESGIDALKESQVPCRFKLQCQGFEHFLYNRTAAYDNILSSLSKDDREKFREYFQEPGGTSSDEESTTKSSYVPKAGSESSSSGTSLNDRNFQEPDTRSSLLRFLPVQFEISRGAFVLGNQSTASILVASYDRMEGTLDVCPPNEKLDMHKVKMQAEFEKLRVTLKPNITFENNTVTKLRVRPAKVSRLWLKFKDEVLKLRDKYKTLSKENDVSTGNRLFVEKWRGLKLYSKESDVLWNDELQFDVSKHEYAKYSKVLKCDKLNIAYSYDVPGVVPHGALPTLKHLDGPDVGNNGAPPDFSIDFQIHAATMYYGPWSHHEILPLQRMLSPILSRNSVPTKKLCPGSRRIYTRLKLSILIIEDSVWRIPTRESSKDFEFLKRYKETEDETRPFGWLDINLAQDTELSLNIAMCPTKEGYDNNLHLYLEKPEIRTSVNHDIMFSAKTQEIYAQVGYPLGWNDKAEWNFDLKSTQAQTFFLKDHIILISDMITDFGSGDPIPYELFRPFVYNFKWQIEGYSIYLNVNDANIVNNPLDFSENCYLSLHGDELNIGFTVPLTDLARNSTTINYTFFTPVFRLHLNTPSWNTLHEFMKNKEVGRSYDFKMHGSYLFHSKLDVDNIDTITVECESKHTTLECYGFVIRYLMSVKMNYFGDFVHFKTAEEYMEELRTSSPDNNFEIDKEELQNSSVDSSWTKSSMDEQSNEHNASITKASLRRLVNEKDVWFTFCVEDGSLIFPENLYDCDSCFGMHFDLLEIDVRYLNYYMDLAAALSPMKLKRYTNFDSRTIFEIAKDNHSKDQDVGGTLSELHIHAHRMFGLPPEEETYFCKWDFQMGVLDITSNLDFAKGFVGVWGKLLFGFKDFENILVYEFAKVFDMTSVTFLAQQVRFLIDVPNQDEKILFNIADLKLTFVDFENALYSKKIDLRIPEILISILRSSKQDSILGHFKTSVELTNFIQLKDFHKHSLLQRAHITKNDAPFHRCPFLLPVTTQNTNTYQDLFGAIPPGVSIPPLAKPLRDETVDEIFESLLNSDNSSYDWNYYENDGTDDTNSRKVEGESNQYNQTIDQIGRELPSDKLFCPDPTKEHENFVLNFGKAELALSPGCLTTFENISQQIYSKTVEELIDSNEIDIVSQFMMNLVGESSIKNAKVVLPHVELVFGELTALDQLENCDHIHIDMFSTNLDCSFENHGTSQAVEMSDKETVVFCKIGAIRASVNERQSRSHTLFKQDFVLHFTSEDIEFWGISSSEMKRTINARSVDMSINSQRIEWLSKYLTSTIESILKITETISRYQEQIRQTQKELFYRIAIASEEYKIVHDPPVITKPAYISRLSKQHVRENRSWRIITRLRHILNYLPRSWSLDTYEALKNKNFSTPSDASEIFLKVFSNWRSWEFSDVEKCYIYKHTFQPELLKKNDNSDIDEKVKAHVATVSLNLSPYAHEEGDSVVIKSLTLVHTCQAVLDLLSSGEVKHQTYKHILENSIACNIKSIKASLGDHCLDLHYLKGILPPPKEDTLVETSLNVNLTHFTCLVDRCDIHFYLNRSRFIIRSFGNNVTGLIVRSKNSGTPVYSFALGGSRSEVAVRFGNNVLFELYVRNGAVGISSIHKDDNTLARFDISSQKSRIKAASTTAQYLSFLEALRHSLDDLITRFQCQLKEKSELPGEVERNSMLSNIALRLSFFDVSSDIHVVSPFIVTQHYKEIDISLEQAEDLIFTSYLRGVDIEIKSVKLEQYYAKLSQSEINVTVELPIDETNTVTSIRVNSEITKLKCNDPRDTLSSLSEDFMVARENIDKIKSLFSEPRSQDESLSNSKFGAFFSESTWILELDLAYLGLLVPLGAVSYVLEFNDLSLSIPENSQPTELGKRLKGPAVGEFEIGSVAFLIHDKLIRNNLSKLVDFAIKLSVSLEGEKNLSAIQIESSFFRVVLCPASLIRILWLINEAARMTDKFCPVSVSDSSIPLKARGIPGLASEFHFIHILSYNFCFGWMFDIETENDPGLIWGYQRLFAAYEKPFGKLTLLDAYFSIARGDNSDTFYGAATEKEQFNRSYLPSMQIGYWFVKEDDDMQDLFIRINGGRLDVNFLSKSIGVANGIIKSMHSFQEMKKKYVDPFRNSENVKKRTNDPSINRVPFFSKLRKVNCKARYAGGVFKLYSGDEIENGLKPSFELESPSVNVVLEYRNKEVGVETHWIRAVVNVDPSHNTLFPTCVPIISDMIKDLRQMLKSLNSRSPSDSPVVVYGEDINYKTMLKAFNIAFMINIEKQEISLSCEPKAKVQADVGFERLNIKMFTNKMDPSEPLSLSLDVEELKATSRHIFSREVSTSFALDYINAVFVLTHPDTIHTYGITHVPNIDVYFNMKQLQDLNVFLNIWKVDSNIYSEPELNNEGVITDIPATEKPLAAKFKKVSANNAFPWNYVLIFSKINGDINLGPSLGTLCLRSGRIWAVTDHYIDWTQKLSLLFERIAVSSEGRLGGNLLLEDLSWTSLINWPLKDGRFQNPLIALSLILSSFSFKASFDYHLILISRVKSLRIKLFNERDASGMLKDLLSVVIHCDSTEIFLTALAPANILDIYNTIMRMRQDNRKSYFETLKDSNTKDTKNLNDKSIIDSLAFLRTDMTVNFGFIYVQVFPSTLFDLEVLIFKARDISTHTQIEADAKVKTQLNWQVHDAKVALSTYKSQLNEKYASKIEVDKYIEHAMSAHGGTILATPAILVAMTTWQDMKTNVVELLYSNSFGGKISIRWNLGSINFIREMWATHVRALSLRRAHIGHPKSLFEDENLEEKIKDMDLGNKYVYIPLEEPHIEIPQIKDLGDATPPVEWFGVNRKRFPGITHQAVVVPLQKLAHLAEKEWSRILGNA